MDSCYWWLSLCELLGDLMGFLCLMCCLCRGCHKTICDITSWFYQFKGSTSAGHSPLDFCNLAHCARPLQLGWKHERTIVLIFYHHFDENAVQELLTQCGRCCNCFKTWVCGKNICKKTHIWQSFGCQVFSFDSFLKKQNKTVWSDIVWVVTPVIYKIIVGIHDVSFSLASGQCNACMSYVKGTWIKVSEEAYLVLWDWIIKKHHSITGQK